LADYILEPEEKYPSNAGEGAINELLDEYDNFEEGTDDSKKVVSLLEDWELYGKSKLSFGYDNYTPQYFIDRGLSIKGSPASLVRYAYSIGANIELGSGNYSIKEIINDSQLEMVGSGSPAYNRIVEGDLVTFNVDGMSDSTIGIASTDGCFMFTSDGIVEVPLVGSGMMDKISHVFRIEGTD